MNENRNFLGTTRDGYEVFDRRNSHIHKESGITEDLIKKALNFMYANGSKFKKKEINFNNTVGVTCCVKVSSEDNIVYVHRKGRFGLTPMVFDRKPEPCNTITIIIRKDDNANSYSLITCFVGGGATREPWDKNIRSAKEKKECEEFWSTHALIYNANEVDWDRM